MYPGSFPLLAQTSANRYPIAAKFLCHLSLFVGLVLCSVLGLVEESQAQEKTAISEQDERPIKAGVVQEGVVQLHSVFNKSAFSSATFTLQSGASNPLNGETTSGESSPDFVDIDNDGDFDVFAGADDGTITYYENTGSNTSPTYVERTGGSNPLNSVSLGSGYCQPDFVDIDDDGDFDVFISDGGTTIHYYQNTGSVSSPTFSSQVSPLTGPGSTNENRPGFVDIDNDLDFDVFLGASDGTIAYFENTGSQSSPTFVQRTGGSNPFNGEDVGSYSSIKFSDVDGDGDWDAFLGEQSGVINYYENTGSDSSPTFTARTGGDNPMNGVDIGSYSRPELADLDNDGDRDMMVGMGTGAYTYYLNTTVIITTAPGGVTSNIVTWLKADAGVTGTSDVSAWADQTGQSNDAAQGDSGRQPAKTDDAINYQPAITFNGSSDFMDIPYSSAFHQTQVQVFSVHKSLGAASYSSPFTSRDAGVTEGYLLYEDTSDLYAFWSASGGSWNGLTGNSVNLNSYEIVSISGVAGVGSAQKYIYQDGAQTGGTTTGTLAMSSSSTPYRVGAGATESATGNYYWNGDIAEQVVYNSVLSQADRYKVETYLALKYGVHISHDYDASDATTLWDATTNATYHNDVAGIGRDDDSELNQKQSTSHSGGIVEIGLGALAPDNASNANTFSADLSFLVWGHDNTATTVTTAFSGSSTNTRMARVWKVEETGTVGTVEIQIPDSYGATHLIVSSNSSLTSPTETALTDNGDGTMSTTVDFADGEFFTFGASTVGPGGVSASLGLWLKADVGVTESAGNVSTWADQSSNGRNAGVSGGTNLPAVASTNLNYNPVVEFDASNSEGMESSSVFGNSTHSNINVFSVAKTNTLTDSFLFGEGSSYSVRVSTHIPWQSNTTIFWDAGAVTGDNRLSTSWTETVGTAYIWGLEYESSASRQAIYRDGTSIASDASVSSFSFSGTNAFQLGMHTNTEHFDGELAEIIVYTGSLTDTEQDQIESYLGIKYGMTVGHDYLASDATTLWSATTNATYHNDVAGIGRDDDSELNQKQSTSQSGGIVEIGLGTLASDNASNANSFSGDLAFMIWGHDNTSTNVTTAFSGSSTNARMARIWKVEETGTVGTVEIQIPDSYGATYLIVSSSSSLTSPTETALTDNGDGTMSTTVNFADGEFFTFGASTVGPGGVTGSLAMWFKADAGVYSDNACTTALTSSDTADALGCWEDQSGNGFTTSQSTSALRADYSIGGLNYNPVFTFDETDDDRLDFSTAPITTPSDIHAYYIIDENDSDGDNHLLGSNGPNSGRFYLRTMTASFGDNASVTATVPSGVYLANANYDLGTTTMTFSVDAGTPISESITWSVAPGTPFKLGAYGASGGEGVNQYNGDLAEMIVFTADHANGNDEQKIQSYLAIKYGLSLPISLIASDATALWDATTNATYHNDVAGIGRDDNAALNQKQSSSQSGGVIAIGLGALAGNNASNANSFSADVSFLVWGHDNASTSITTSFSGTNVFTRMARVWKVEETGTVGTVEVQIPDTYDATYLIVSSNSALTSPTEVALTDNGDGTRSTTVDFSDGQFFSFGVGASPGGVFADLEIWLKADAGVTESSNDVSAWADQSGNGSDASQGTSNRQPIYDSVEINYNPAINFDGNLAGDGSGDYLEASAGYYDKAVFVVFEPDGDIIPKSTTVYTTGQQLIGVDANGNASEDGFDIAGVFVGDGTNAADNELIVMRGDADDGGTTYSASYEDITQVLSGGEPLLVVFNENATNNGKDLFQNGSALSITEYNTYESVSDKPYRIGNDWNTYSSPTDGDSQRGSGSMWYNGDIAELIVYSARASTSALEQIETYLGLKYGISIAHNYVASDATVLWNSTTNATYHNDVFGIGRDDVSALNQKQSGASIVTVALGTVAADNASNANNFSSDLTFLVLGHNNGALTESAVTIGAYTADQLARKWLAEETSDTGSSLEFQFDLTGVTVSGTTAAEFKLVLDTDTDPSNGSRQIVSAASYSSNIVTFSSVDIQDGDYLILLTDYDLAPTGPPLTDGGSADGVIGQPDMNSRDENNGGISAATLNGPTYIALGPTGKLFVADTDNHRVLRWSSAAAVSDGSSAEAVLGQADFTSNSANRGSSVAANTMYGPTGVFVSSSGALYVSDSQNHRILRFDNAESAADGAAADGVLGQADFISAEPNRRQNVAANSLRWPKDLHVDGSGNLWVADWLNHRVVRYDNVSAKADGADADGVLGQATLLTRDQEWQNQTDEDSFVYPAGVYVDGSGTLWVSDAANSRVLRFDNAASAANGAAADGVLGQEDFTSWRANQGTLPAADNIHWPDSGIGGDNQGGIWVADRWGDRVLWFEDAATKADGADADGVIGQPDFTSRHGFVDDASFNSVTDVLIDTSNEYVWIVDNAHNRILRFEATAATLAKAPDTIDIDTPEPVTAFALYQNYPNPFNPNTRIGYDLPEKTYVRLEVYDMLGRLVEVLVDSEVESGRHEVVFEAGGLPSGIYFYRMKTKDWQQVRKMLLAK